MGSEFIEKKLLFYNFENVFLRPIKILKIENKM